MQNIGVYFSVLLPARVVFLGLKLTSGNARSDRPAFPCVLSAVYRYTVFSRSMMPRFVSELCLGEVTTGAILQPYKHAQCRLFCCISWSKIRGLNADGTHYYMRQRTGGAPSYKRMRAQHHRVNSCFEIARRLRPLLFLMSNKLYVRIAGCVTIYRNNNRFG